MGDTGALPSTGGHTPRPIPSMTAATAAMAALWNKVLAGTQSLAHTTAQQARAPACMLGVRVYCLHIKAKGQVQCCNSQ